MTFTVSKVFIQRFFAIDVLNNQVLWNVNFAGVSARRLEGKRTECKSFIATSAENISSQHIITGPIEQMLDHPYRGWVVYALCSETKQVIDFTVGKRNKRTLRVVVNTLLQSGMKIIKTDRLNIYRSLIPPKLHIANAYNINHIERNNLNLRTHLKRLSRRTICFSKNLAMLDACLRIYFWSHH